MIQYEIERLIVFGRRNQLIEKEDCIPVRNALMDLLQVSAPYKAEAAYTGETATEILEHILDYCAETGLITENTITHRDAFSARIMGLLMPRQSEVIRRFYENYAIDPTAATDAFYQLSRASNYIQVDRVNKNLYWTSAGTFGELELTINLSKPEKDPRDIIAAKNAPQTTYPKCLLCPENAGFAGTLTRPARQNHRVIPIRLHKEPWYFQYSPYVYYQEHCIIIDEVHRPMEIQEATFWRLLDFVEQFPHYFIGSNADLPIVGGSMLSHDHFQGGRHVFPMEKAQPYRTYSHPQFKACNISIVKWPMSVVRISGEKKDELIALAMHIFEGWKQYSDPAAEILAYTGDTPHNTVTPIGRKDERGLFEFDIVLRNNRTTEEHPLGLFHPHENLHHIKKENIGLIEVMGLAVLPGRLQGELEDMQAVLQCRRPFDPSPIKDPSHPLFKHLDWLVYLTSTYGTENSQEEAESILKRETAKVFEQVLADAGVFPYNKLGIQQFETFMKSLGFFCK